MCISTHSSLEGTQTGRFDIRGLVGEPEPRGHVHDEAERVPVFNLRHPHALDVPLGALLQLLLRGRGGRGGNEDVKSCQGWERCARSGTLHEDLSPIDHQPNVISSAVVVAPPTAARWFHFI